MEEKKEKPIVVIGSGQDMSEVAKKVAEAGYSMDDIKVVTKEEFNEEYSRPAPPRSFRDYHEALHIELERYKEMDNPYFLDENLISKKFRGGLRESVRDSKENPKINRNAPCPCGSGKKYKKCCSNK